MRDATRQDTTSFNKWTLRGIVAIFLGIFLAHIGMHALDAQTFLSPRICNKMPFIFAIDVNALQIIYFMLENLHIPISSVEYIKRRQSTAIYPQSVCRNVSVIKLTQTNHKHPTIK